MRLYRHPTLMKPEALQLMQRDMAILARIDPNELECAHVMRRTEPRSVEVVYKNKDKTFNS